MAEWDNLVIDFFSHQLAFPVPRYDGIRNDGNESFINSGGFNRQPGSTNYTFPQFYSQSGTFINGFYTRRSSVDYVKPSQDYDTDDFWLATRLNSGSHKDRPGGLYCERLNDQESEQVGKILIEPARWGCARPMQMIATVHADYGTTHITRRHGKIELQLDPTPARNGDGVKGVLDCFSVPQKTRIGMYFNEFVSGSHGGGGYWLGYSMGAVNYGTFSYGGAINRGNQYSIQNVYTQKFLFLNSSNDLGNIFNFTLRTPNSYRGFPDYQSGSSHNTQTGAVQLLQLYEAGQLKKEVEHWYESFNLRLAVYQPNDTTGKAKVFIGVLDQAEAWGIVEECETDFLQHDKRGKLGHAFASYRVIRPSALTGAPFAYASSSVNFNYLFMNQYWTGLGKYLYGYSTAEGAFADPAWYDMNIFLTSVEYGWNDFSYHIATLPPTPFQSGYGGFTSNSLRPFCKRSGGALGDYIQINRYGPYYSSYGNNFIPENHQVYKGGHFPHWGTWRDTGADIAYSRGTVTEGCEQPVVLYTDKPSDYNQREFVKKSFFASPKTTGKTHAPAFLDDDFTANNLSVEFKFDTLEMRTSADKFSMYNPECEFINHSETSYSCGSKQRSFVVRYREQYLPNDNHDTDPFNTNFTINPGGFYGQRISLMIADFSLRTGDWNEWNRKSANRQDTFRTDGHEKSVTGGTYVWDGSQWIPCDTSRSNQIFNYKASVVDPYQKRAGDYFYCALNGIQISLGDKSSAGKQLAQGLYYGDQNLNRVELDSEPMAISSTSSSDRNNTNVIFWSDSGGLGYSPPAPYVGDGGLSNPEPTITGTTGPVGGNNTTQGTTVTGSTVNNTTGGNSQPASEYWRDDQPGQPIVIYNGAGNLISAIESNIAEGNAGVVATKTTLQHQKENYVPAVSNVDGSGGGAGNNTTTGTTVNNTTGGNNNNYGGTTRGGYWETVWETMEAIYYLASPLCYYYNNKTRALRCQAFGSVVKNVIENFGSTHSEPVGQLKAPSDFYETDGEEKATSSGLLAHKGGLGSTIPYAPGQVRFNFILYLDVEEVCENINGYGGQLRSNQYATGRRYEIIEVTCPPIQARNFEMGSNNYIEPGTGLERQAPLRHTFSNPPPLPNQLAQCARLQLRCGVVLSKNKAAELKNSGYLKVNFPLQIFENYTGEREEKYQEQFEDDGAICYAVIQDGSFPVYQETPDIKNSDMMSDFYGLHQDFENSNTAGVFYSERQVANFSMNHRDKFLRRLSANGDGSITLRLS